MTKNLPFYSLSVSFNRCFLKVTCNGFPVIRSAAPSILNHQYAINHLLIGTRNLLEFSVSTSKEHSIANIKSATVKGSLKVFQKGEIVTPEDGKVVQLYDLSPQIAECPAPFESLLVPFHFDNLIHDFSKLFVHSRPITNMEDVKSYGMYLIDIFRRRNVNAIMNEFSQMLPDIAEAGFASVDEVKHQLMESLIENILSKDLDADFTRDDLKIIPWCGNRICEIVAMPGKKPLISTKRDESWSNAEISIFVALVGKDLKIVRN